jgi:hypothetical protein
MWQDPDDKGRASTRDLIRASTHALIQAKLFYPGCVPNASQCDRLTDVHDWNLLGFQLKFLLV